MPALGAGGRRPAWTLRLGLPDPSAQDRAPAQPRSDSGACACVCARVCVRVCAVLVIPQERAAACTTSVTVLNTASSAEGGAAGRGYGGHAGGSTMTCRRANRSTATTAKGLSREEESRLSPGKVVAPEQHGGLLLPTRWRSPTPPRAPVSISSGLNSDLDMVDSPVVTGVSSMAVASVMGSLSQSATVSASEVTNERVHHVPHRRPQPPLSLPGRPLRACPGCEF